MTTSTPREYPRVVQSIRAICLPLTKDGSVKAHRKLSKVRDLIRQITMRRNLGAKTTLDLYKIYEETRNR